MARARLFVVRSKLKELSREEYDISKLEEATLLLEANLHAQRAELRRRIDAVRGSLLRKSELASITESCGALERSAAATIHGLEQTMTGFKDTADSLKQSLRLDGANLEDFETRLLELKERLTEED